jgi:putative membrane protein
MQRSGILAAICGAALFCLPVLAASAPRKGSTNDQQFVDSAAVMQMTQAHLGKLAQDQANQADVKNFGQKLVQDDTTAYSELRQLASKNGETVPKGINIRKDPAAERLVSLKGNGFDRQFARDEVLREQRAIALYKHESEHGHDADLKAYASKMLPTLQDQLQKAKDLEKPAKHS